jgi:hypothetical protein
LAAEKESQEAVLMACRLVAVKADLTVVGSVEMTAAAMGYVKVELWELTKAVCWDSVMAVRMVERMAGKMANVKAAPRVDKKVVYLADRWVVWLVASTVECSVGVRAAVMGDLSAVKSVAAMGDGMAASWVSARAEQSAYVMAAGTEIRWVEMTAGSKACVRVGCWVAKLEKGLADKKADPTVGRMVEQTVA